MAAKPKSKMAAESETWQLNTSEFLPTLQAYNAIPFDASFSQCVVYA